MTKPPIPKPIYINGSDITDTLPTVAAVVIISLILAAVVTP